MERVNRDQKPTFVMYDEVTGEAGYQVWDVDHEGWTVSHEVAITDRDGTTRFAKLPGGGCQCPHWGYVIHGESTYVYQDHEATYRTGEFFYLAPGHRPKHKKGTEWVTFSPTEPHRAAQRLTRGTADTK